MSPETCGKNMINGMLKRKQPGFHLFDANGDAKVNKHHNDEYMNKLWDHTLSLLKLKE